MSLTCERCLDGDSHLCRGGDCAAFQRGRLDSKVSILPKKGKSISFESPFLIRPEPRNGFRVSDVMLDAIQQARMEGCPDGWIFSHLRVSRLQFLERVAEK